MIDHAIVVVGDCDSGDDDNDNETKHPPPPLKKRNFVEEREKETSTEGRCRQDYCTVLYCTFTGVRE